MEFSCKQFRKSPIIAQASRNIWSCRVSSRDKRCIWVNLTASKHFKIKQGEVTESTHKRVLNLTIAFFSR